MRNGNVQGGVRSPQVDAPLAVLSGVGQSGGGFCGLFGTTVPFTAAQLAALYPNHQRFVREWRIAVQRGVAQGFLLAADGRDLVQAAADSDIGR